MKRAWVHPTAWDEIGQVAEYYEKRREGLGERFFNELERVKSLLCEVQLGAKIDDRHRVRRCRVSRTRSSIARTPQ